MNRNELLNMKASELKAIAKEVKVPNWWNLNKQALVDALETTKPKYEFQDLNTEEYCTMVACGVGEAASGHKMNAIDMIVVEEIDNKQTCRALKSLHKMELIKLFINKKKGGESRYQITDRGYAWLERKDEFIPSVKESKPEPKKKGSKKPTQKKEKEVIVIKEDDYDQSNLMTLKALCSEIGIEEMKARRHLRRSSIIRPYGTRWEWDIDKHGDWIEAVRDLLKSKKEKVK